MSCYETIIQYLSHWCSIQNPDRLKRWFVEREYGGQLSERENWAGKRLKGGQLISERLSYAAKDQMPPEVGNLPLGGWS